MSECISKRNVPVQSRPTQWLVYLVYLAGVYAVSIWLIPEMRPCGVELAIGTGWAYLCIQPILRAYIAIVEYLALLDRGQPCNMPTIPKVPMWLYGTATWGLARKYRQIYLGSPRLIDFLPALGALFTIITAHVLWIALSGLTTPWARYDGVTRDFPVPVQSMVLSAIVYAISFASFFCIGTIRWYRQLPDE